MWFIIGLFAMLLVRRRVKPLVILDMNGVFIHREYNSQREDADLKQGRFSIWLRPGLSVFFRTLFREAHVAVFTSMQTHNAVSMVDFVFGNDWKSRLVFVKTQDDCTMVQEKGFFPDNPNKPLLIKQIPWYLWVVFPRIYIVDNDMHKIAVNPPYTHILLNTWLSGEDNDDLEIILRTIR
jgi:hypothetical protein